MIMMLEMLMLFMVTVGCNSGRVNDDIYVIDGVGDEVNEGHGYN